MGWIKYNEHPYNYSLDDCVLRAISTFFDISWEEAYLMVMTKGYELKVFPTNMNVVWESALLDKGLKTYEEKVMTPPQQQIQNNNFVTKDDMASIKNDIVNSVLMAIQQQQPKGDDGIRG